MDFSKTYRIYDLVPPDRLPSDLSIPPYTVDFKTGLTTNLAKKTILKKGERKSSIYYQSYDLEANEYIRKILRVDYSFDRDEDGLIYKKTKTISWLLRDGSYGEEPKVETTHITEPREKLKEIKIRRANIIEELKGLGKQLNLEEHIAPFFEKYQTEASQFVEAGSRLLREAISKSDDSWLDTVIPATGNTPREVFYIYFSI